MQDIAACPLCVVHQQGQASSRALECELLRKKLAAAESTNTGLRTDLQDSQQQVSELRQELQATESAAGESQQELAEEVRALRLPLFIPQWPCDRRAMLACVGWTAGTDDCVSRLWFMHAVVSS